MADRVIKVNRVFWPFGLLSFMTYVGAAIYFVSHSNGGFWGVILGLLQAIIWPVYLVFHVLTLLHV